MIAKILGIWMIIMALALIGKREYFRRVIKGIGEEKVADFAYASMLIFLGLVLVCFHNYWVMNQLLLVTVACWLILIKGLIWLTFPEWMFRTSAKLVDSPWYWVMSIITLAYGIVLLSYSRHFLTFYEFPQQIAQ
jgi:hypothetical protein